MDVEDLVAEQPGARMVLRPSGRNPFQRLAAELVSRFLQLGEDRRQGRTGGVRRYSLSIFRQLRGTHLVAASRDHQPARVERQVATATPHSRITGDVRLVWRFVFGETDVAGGAEDLARAEFI